MLLPPITPDILLSAYASGFFPMAKDRHSPALHWYYPEKRGVLPLAEFHIPRSLTKFMRKQPYRITVDTAFPDVIQACAERPDTWINDTIIALYTEVWKQGDAHSIECWEGDTLVGGLYGVALGGAFFGESMFSRATNASKIALVHLVGLLKSSGYTLLDAQFVNEHLHQFGMIEIAREDYLRQLNTALEIMPNKAFTRGLLAIS